MTPLFDIEEFASPAVTLPRVADRLPHPRASATTRPAPVNYWIRGVFRFSGGDHTRTVHGVGMNSRLDAEVATFVAYLQTEGFQFSEGRAVMIELLGVGADDGEQISISVGKDKR